MFGWGTSDFFAASFSKKFGYFRTFFWAQAAGLVFASLLIFVFGLNTNLRGLMMALLPLAASLYAVGYLLFYKGFEVGNVVIIATVVNAWVVLTMVLAFIFLGQRLSSPQLLGTLMIIFGVILTAFKWEDLKSQGVQLLAGVKETLVSAIFFSVFWNLSDVISGEIGWLSTTVFIKAWVVLFLLVFAFLAKRKIVLAQATTKEKLIAGLIGALEATAIVSVNFGLAVGDVILVAPISSALAVVTIVLAIVFLKEKITKLQGLGIVAALAGIVLTAF